MKVIFVIVLVLFFATSFLAARENWLAILTASLATIAGVAFLQKTLYKKMEKIEELLKK